MSAWTTADSSTHVSLGRTCRSLGYPAAAVAAYPAAANRSRIFGVAVGALTVLVVFFMVWKPKLW